VLGVQHERADRVRRRTGQYGTQGTGDRGVVEQRSVVAVNPHDGEPGGRAIWIDHPGIGADRASHGFASGRPGGQPAGGISGVIA
jgi:hypothetical protein